jgi:hypothetical protein
MSHSNVQLTPCELTQLGLRRTGRCTGQGRERGETRQVVLYAWTMQRQLGIALFFARSPIEKVLPESDDIVGSIEHL